MLKGVLAFGITRTPRGLVPRDLAADVGYETMAMELMVKCAIHYLWCRCEDKSECEGESDCEG